MLQARSPWRQRCAPDDVVAELEHELDLSHLTARLLALRGVTDPTSAERFLAKRLSDLHPPERLRDMDVAARRFARAIEERQRILVHGDFDVDGSTATTLLKLFCRCCSHDAEAWIPHRVEDGYGLTESSYQAVEEHAADLMITVDCGIVDHGWAGRIQRDLGCDVIVTDHHLPQDDLPDCLAVCNPNREDCDYPDKGLAGVGVAWKLAWATARELCGSDKVSDRLRGFLLDALALVAVGTIADCAPLSGENRILVHHGLHALGSTTNPGLQALLQHNRLQAPIGTDDVGWKISPLLNASGRLSSAMRNIRLLTAPDASAAAAVLEEVVSENEERKRLSQILTEDLMAEVTHHHEYLERASLVFAGEGWHPGVVGIVASRLTERFGKPACVIAVEDGLGKGSMRTVPGVHLGHALAACQEHLVKGGGHAAAAGLTIRADRVDAFSQALESHLAQRFPGGIDPPGIEHDGEATMAELDAAFFDDLARLEPFGNANPAPVLSLRSVGFVTRPQIFGRNGDHVRGALSGGDGGMRQIYLWKGRDLYQDLCRPGCRLDLLVTPQLNRWRGETSPRLVFVDGQLA